jgi:homoserine dehydrogenase
MILRLAMVGFGNVGQEFARLLLDKQQWLVRSKGLDVEVHSISTRTRGSISSKKALDLEKVLRLMKENGDLRSYGPELTTSSPIEVLSKSDADMMIELSTLNIESGQPAIDNIRSAMENGMDVVTANKGPIAFAYRDLRNLSRSKGVHFRFEGTVMDGTPIFNLVERTLPGCTILGLSGILNSTSNFVLAQMGGGKSMEEAIKEAQKRGFAEADPSLDIDGWDAAAKITALANVLMDARMTPKMVKRTGIKDVRVDDIRKAAVAGKKIKMIASANPVAEGVKLDVTTQMIGPEHPFWSVDGTSSALTIRTDLMGDLTMIESNPVVTQTAYAVFSDMLLTVEAIRSGTI